ncbi:MAG: hypothetical protein ACO2PL_10790 [Armatimonadota bacterium]
MIEGSDFLFAVHYSLFAIRHSLPFSARQNLALPFFPSLVPCPSSRWLRVEV